MKRADRQALRALARRPRDAAAHFTRRFVGVGERQDLVGGEVGARFQQVDDARGDHARFSRSRSGDDDQRAFAVRHGRALLRVQPVAPGVSWQHLEQRVHCLRW